MGAEREEEEAGAGGGVGKVSRVGRGLLDQ